MARLVRPLCLLALALASVPANGAQAWLPGPAAPDGGRQEHAMAYDSARGRVVMFGGVSTVALSETWEFDGTSWRVGPAAPAALGTRVGHAMAFDAGRSRVVLYGGGKGGTYQGDTWEYDGAMWYLVSPSGSPGARAEHCLAYDSLRGVTVLFGGETVSATWEYDGSAWTQAANGPPAMLARWRHGMAYDVVRTRVVLFGGYAFSTGNRLNDTWEYDGAAWTPGPAAPGQLVARDSMGMAFDGARARTVLFGGTNGAANLEDTWEYDGTAWSLGPVVSIGLVGRQGSAIAFDSARGRCVMFGGGVQTGPLNDTWEYAGVAWTPVPAQRPGPRYNHTMAYDSTRGRLVLHSGRGGQQSGAYETWEYDGATWMLAPMGPVGLGTRQIAAMSYDAARQRVVLFGGSRYNPLGSAVQNDTWEYDGAAWTPGPAAPPGLVARGKHTMAFDSVRARTVLFGGITDPGTLLDDTWEYDGAAWVVGPAAPVGLVGRYAHAMAFDGARGCVVLHGGQGGSGVRNDVWEYDGAAWTSAGAGPGARSYHEIAYDGTRSRLVLFGGYNSGIALNDTWEYDGSVWVAGGGPGGMSARYAFAMAFDPTQSRIVLFGGNTTTGIGGDTWEYDGTTWTQDDLAPTKRIIGLGERREHAMAFDATRNRVVLFGGRDYFALHNDAWECDGTTWRVVPGVPAGLTARDGMAMAFDAVRGRTVLFGGSDATGRRGDTWEYNGTLWFPGPAPPPALTPRDGHAMAYDSVRSRVVLFGGNDGARRNDAWEYDGAAWTPGAAAPPALTAREGHAMAFDAARSVSVLFGGNDGSRRNDTWEYDGSAFTPGPAAPAGLTPREGHVMGFDTGRNVVIAFGGDDGVRRNDTWEYDGTGWAPGGPPAAALTARAGHAAVFDASRGELLLFGGDDGAERRDVWKYGCPVIALNPSTLPNGAVGSPYSQTLTPSGGTPPITFAVQSGALPPGLTLLPDGQVTGTPTLGGAHSFTARATDVYGCAGSRGYTLSIDCAVTVAPATLPAGIVGIPYSRTLTAGGGTPPYQFTVIVGSPPPGITLDVNGVLAGTSIAAGSYPFTVRVTDAGSCAGTRAYTLVIGNCPAIAISPPSLPGGVPGVPYAQTLTAAGGDPPYTFAVTVGALPPGTSLAATGVISGTPITPGLYAFTATATDAMGCTGNKPYALPVNCGNVTLDPPSLPSGTIQAPYSQTITASGGVAPYSYLVTAGALPPGLALSAAGVLDGTPVAQGVFTFTVSAIDAVSCTGARTYSLGINCVSIAIAPASLPLGTLGIPYAETLTASGGAAPYVFVVTAGTLPPGLSLQPDGVLSGTPSTPGSFSFTVTATDASGCAGSRGYTVIVGNCGAIVLSPSTLPQATLGVGYAATITASGGVAPYTFAVTAGALPSGLALTSGGLLSGTPAATGSFGFSVTATDANACTGSGAYVLLVGCSIDVLPVTLPDGTVGAPYSVQLTASGGVPPYTYGVTGGALAPGLSLAASGLISGAPTAAGSFNVQVTATDSGGCSGYRDYVLRVVEAVDYVVGQGLGPPNANRVRVFDASGAATTVDFLAYAAGAWGVGVASGDVDGGVHAEVLTGPGPGPVFGPQVRAFTRYGAGIAKVNFFAYGTLKFGVNAAGAALDADPYLEMATGPGPGAVFGPHTRGFDYDAVAVAALAKINFFAYGTLKYGVNVASADVDGDGYGELLTGPGPGPAFGAQVRGFDYDGTAVTAIAKLNYAAFSGAFYGASVAGGDVEGDGFDEILASRGAGPAEPASFVGHDFDGAALGPLPGFATTPFTTTFGSRVGAAGVGGDGSDDLLAGAGRDPGADSRVKAFDYDGAALAQLAGSFVPFGTAGYGVNVAGGALGY